MDVVSVENVAIKSEVILTETFSFSAKYEDCESQELKTEPTLYEDLFKCKEDSVEHIDIHAAPTQCINECNFTTIEKDCLTEHLNITKNVQYSCKECNFITQLEYSIKEHIKIHNGVDGQYITEECNFKMPRILSLIPELKTPRIRNKYICNECNYTTFIKSNLRRHITIHKGDDYIRDKYKCEECDYKTLQKNLLKQHVKIHTGHKYECQECDYKTVWKNQLKQHVKIHTGDEYKCKECDYKTVWNSNLKEHIKIHTGDEFKCKECNYKTVLQSSLKKHIKIHTGHKYECQECNYKTVRKNELKEHVKIHTDDEYKCKECDYKTVRKNQLKQHVKIHTDDEYKCKDCDYKSVRKYQLKQHVKIHTGNEYKCKECDYKTVRKCRLKEHVKIHTGDEYNCAVCDYKTVWKSRLQEHVKIHTGDKYKCKECDYKTVRKNQLKEHTKIHTGDTYKCKECDYKTVRKDRLKQHVKIHTGDEYKCKECDYKTVRKNQLNQHVKIHTGDEYKCKECPYKTVRKNELKEHVKIHTGDEYKCKECDYKTVWKNNLKQHVTIHTVIGDTTDCPTCAGNTQINLNKMDIALKFIENGKNTNKIKNEIKTEKQIDVGLESVEVNNMSFKEQINEVCRTCLTKYSNFQSIFEKDLHNMLMEFTSVKIIEGDGLSSIICQDCVLQIYQTYIFKQRVEHSDNVLKQDCFYIDREGEINEPSKKYSENVTSVRVDCDQSLSNQLDIDIVENDYLEDISNTEIINAEKENMMTTTKAKENIQIEENLIGSNKIDCGKAKKNYVCSICGKRLYKPRGLKDHMRTHAKEKPYKCDISSCNKSFVTIKNLKYHKRLHGGSYKMKDKNTKYVCTVCAIKCTKLSHLKIHMKIHIGEKPFKCEISNCSKSFKSSRKLNRHKRSHTGSNKIDPVKEKKYVCSICGKKLSKPHGLKDHMRTHTEEKP
ncbi:hypothetical protein FQA39_LY02066 [Lamprigera yunnana]|nr:hypothetical protein FQA39_LY02066 [Lamprigera yunnana]